MLGDSLDEFLTGPETPVERRDSYACAAGDVVQRDRGTVFFECGRGGGHNPLAIARRVRSQAGHAASGHRRTLPREVTAERCSKPGRQRPMALRTDLRQPVSLGDTMTMPHRLDRRLRRWSSRHAGADADVGSATTFILTTHLQRLCAVNEVQLAERHVGEFFVERQVWEAAQQCRKRSAFPSAPAAPEAVAHTVAERQINRARRG